MRILFIAGLCFTASLYAMDIEAFAQKALSHHPKLQAIKARFAAAQVDLTRARSLDNPLLWLSINDMRLDAISDRRLEPMQSESLTIAQKIPFFGKRDAKEAIFKAMRELEGIHLADARARLKAAIIQEAWRLWELRKLYEITRQTRNLTRQKVELFDAYTASIDTPSAHTALMSAELVDSRLTITLADLKEKIDAAKAMLGYLSFAKGDLPPLQMKPRPLPTIEEILARLKSSPTLREKNHSATLEKRRLDALRLETKIDPIIKIGYFHRTSYEDYLSVGLGLSLPIYGTEESRIESGRARVLAKDYETLDTLKYLRSKIKNLWHRAKAKERVATILQKKSLPQIAHMFELIESDVQAGGDLFRFVDLIEQKFKLQADYIRAVAQKERLIAKIKGIVP